VTVETDIFAVIKGLAAVDGAGRACYPDVARQGAPTPYIIYQQVGGEAPTFLENAVPSKKNGRFQITCWSPSRSEAVAKIIAVEAAMVTATAFQARPVGAPVSLYDEDTGLRGSAQDFTVWSNR